MCILKATISHQGYETAIARVISRNEYWGGTLLSRCIGQGYILHGVRTAAIELHLPSGNTARQDPLCGELLTEELLQGLAVLSKLADTLVQLVCRHLVLAECPAEFSLVVDVRHLGDGLALCGVVRVELLGDGRVVVLELLEQVRRDGQEVDAGKSLDLASLQCDK